MNSLLKYDDIIQADFPFERQFHILKHFTYIDHEYRAYLIRNSEYSDDEIDDQLKLKGSMFFKHFVSNPENLIDVLSEKIKNGHAASGWIGNRCEIGIEFSKSEFPKGIGEDHVIHVDELPEHVKDKLQDLNPETFKKHGLLYVPKITWTVNLIIEKVNNKPVIISVFPGVYAPPLPNEEIQSDEEFQISADFWSRHVLIS